MNKASFEKWKKVQTAWYIHDDNKSLMHVHEYNRATFPISYCTFVNHTGRCHGCTREVPEKVKFIINIFKLP